VVEEERVQDLADEEGGARKGMDSSGTSRVAAGLRRSPITSTLSAPSRNAGESGVFWRNPPSQKNRSPTAMAGNRIGSAADASACSGPMVTACARTKGSLLHCGRRSSARCTKTTLLPDPISVAVTDSDSTFPRRMLSVMRPHGINRRTTRSSLVVWTIPPRRRSPSTSSMWPLPRMVAGARRNSLTPKVTISSRTKLSQRSTSMRPCLAAISAVPAKKQAWIAPTEVPEMMSNWT